MTALTVTAAPLGQVPLQLDMLPPICLVEDVLVQL